MNDLRLLFSAIGVSILVLSGCDSSSVSTDDTAPDVPLPAAERRPTVPLQQRKNKAGKGHVNGTRNRNHFVVFIVILLPYS
jgi:hypothetical protein